MSEASSTVEEEEEEERKKKKKRQYSQLVQSYGHDLIEDNSDLIGMRNAAEWTQP